MSSSPAEGSGDRWLNGFTFPSNACDFDGNTAVPIACDASYDFGAGATTDSNDEVLDAETAIRPLLYWAGAKCSTVGSDLGEVSRRAIDNLTSVFSAQVEKEFWNGAVTRAQGLGNQHLNDGNATALNGGTQLGFVRALAELQAAWASCGDGARGMIHATVRTASLWYTAGAITKDSGLLIDAFGNIVVAGPGYGGESPSYSADATGNSAWAYVTPVVAMRITQPEVMLDTTDRIDKTNNVDRAIAGRAAAVYHDPCCKYGVKVNHSSAC